MAKKAAKKTAKKPAKKTAKASAKTSSTQATRKAPKKTGKKAPGKRHAANNKTTKTRAPVESYLETLDEPRKGDCERLTALMRAATRDAGSMWGASIAGFGHTHLVYETGREMDWFMVGFSSRKQALTLYLMGNFATRDSLLERLGPHKRGKGCVYIKRLDDVDLGTLKKLIAASVKAMKAADTA